MKKIVEMDALELSSLLIEIAEPIGNLADDDEVFECFRKCTTRGLKLKQRDGLHFILKTYSKLIPLLLGEKHKRDTLRILAAIEGKSVNEIIHMNGKQLIDDFRAAWEDKLEGFFTQSVPTEQADASSH